MGGDEATVVVPIHPDLSAAIAAMPRSNVVHLNTQRFW
jgi:hypothetical protein